MNFHRTRFATTTQFPHDALADAILLLAAASLGGSMLVGIVIVLFCH